MRESTVAPLLKMRDIHIEGLSAVFGSERKPAAHYTLSCPAKADAITQAVTVKRGLVAALSSVRASYPPSPCSHPSNRFSPAGRKPNSAPASRMAATMLSP